MPMLENPKHELFAQGLAEGKSASEAYEHAGYAPHRSAASRLSTNVNVQARVAELQGRAAAKVELGRADVLNMLVEDRQLARQLGQASAAIKAAELLGRELAGMFIERKEVGKPGDFSRLSDDELDRTIAERARGISRPAHRERTTH